MFIIDDEDMLFIFSNSCLFLITFENDEYETKKIQILDKNMKRDSIKKVKFVCYEKKNKKFYLLITLNNNFKEILQYSHSFSHFTFDSSYSYNLNKSIKIKSIEIDNESSDQVYLIGTDKIYLCTLSKTKKIMSKIGMTRKNINLSNYILNENLIIKAPVIKRFKLEFDMGHNNKNNFIKFDKQMKFFFIPHKNIIKQYEVKSKIVVHNYEGHMSNVKEMILSNDGQHLISLDENDHIKIWNLDSNNLITTLNEQHRFKNLSQIKLIEGDSILSVMQKDKVGFWKLENNIKSISFDSRDLNKSELMIIKDENKEQIVFNLQNEKIMFRPLKAKTMKSQLFLKDYAYHQVLNNGDIISVKKINESKGAQDIHNYILYLIPNPNKATELSQHNLNTGNDDLLYNVSILFSDNKTKDQQEIKQNINQIKVRTEGTITAYYLETINIPNIKQLSVLNIDEANESLSLESNYRVNFYYGTSKMNCYFVSFEIQNNVQIVNIKKRTFFHLEKFKSTENNKLILKNKIFKCLNNIKKSDTNDPIHDLLKIKSKGKQYFIIVYTKTRQAKKMINKGQTKNDNPILEGLCYVKIKNLEDNESKKDSESNKSVIFSTGKTVYSDSFKIKQISCQKDEDYKFILINSSGIALISKKSSDTNPKAIKYLKKKIRLEVGIEFSAYKDKFYIPSRKSVQIWDSSLHSSIYSINLKQEVLKIILTESSNEYLIIYDQSNYYEINLNNLEFERKFNIIKTQTEISIVEKISLPINIDLLPRNFNLTLPYFNEEITDVYFISSVDNLNLKYFPFNDLRRALEPEDYTQPILNFAKYYFDHISKANYNDNYFGSLSPILMSIYHNNIDLLKTLLETFRYPNQVQPNFSPLIYAFDQNLPSIIKIICDKLQDREYQVQFSKEDFLLLIRSSSGYCHRLLAKFFNKPSIKYFPKLLNLNRQPKVFFVNHVDELNGQIMNHENKVLKKPKKKKSGSQTLNSKSIKSSGNILIKNFIQTNLKKKRSKKLKEKKKVDFNYQFESDTDMEKVIMTDPLQLLSNAKYRLKNHKISKKNDFIEEAIVNKVPFKFNYKAGTMDSLLFLKSYSSSNHEEFVLSDWKEIVINKWASCIWIYICLTLMYWLFTAGVTLSIIFYPNVKALRIVNIFCIFFFLLYEILEIVSYCSFNTTSYLSEPWNYVDWISFVILLTYFFGYYDQPESKINQLLSTFALILTYYRSFSYLRIIDSFTTMVGMINTIIIKLKDFFAILFYFYLTTGLLMKKLNSGNSISMVLQKTYTLTLFGGVSPENFREYPFALISIIFGTLMVTIVLLNILIAYLSNLFSRLEDRQQINDLKEKAGMTLDMEIIIYFFKNRFRKKTEDQLNLSALQHSYYDRSIRQQSSAKDEKILYIFKPVDYKEILEENEIDENIYKKLKIVYRNIMDVNKSLLKRDKIINTNIKAFISVLNDHSNLMKDIISEK